MPRLARITIYPIKSLDGFEVVEAKVLPGGALEYDRRFAIVDADGEVVNGKRREEVHHIRSSYDPRTRTLSLGIQGREDRTTFAIDADRAAVQDWLSGVFGFPVTLIENPEAGFPDDTDSPGPTVASAATWEEVAGWFPGLDAAEVRRRFRANLEVGEVEPFWEDRLFTEPDGVVRFRIGEVVFEGVNPCQRCVVPSRSATTGDSIRGFSRTFAERRRVGLPDWAAASRFDHFYRLAVNTQPARDSSGTIRIGDEVEILGDFPRVGRCDGREDRLTCM